jgi:hypothetical protein
VTIDEARRTPLHPAHAQSKAVWTIEGRHALIAIGAIGGAFAALGPLRCVARHIVIA